LGFDHARGWSITLSDWEVEHIRLLDTHFPQEFRHEPRQTVYRHIQLFAYLAQSRPSKRRRQPSLDWCHQAVAQHMSTVSQCRLSRLINGESAVFTRPTWGELGVQEVHEMLSSFGTHDNSRVRPGPTFRKPSAISTGSVKPPKKPPKNDRKQWTHKKAKPKT